MSTIVTRSGKGTPLTNTEVDANFTNLNTDKLELSGGTLTGNLSLGTNNKAIFNSQLEIYGDGSHSYISDVGTGNLIIKGTHLNLRDANNTLYMEALQGGAVTLRHAGNISVATTSTGISISNDANFPDNGKAIFGAGNDLQIYHDGSHSRLVDNGTGNFIIQAGQFRVNTANDSEAMIKADVDGAVSLYNSGDQKLATTATGIDVTGSVTADGLTVDGTGYATLNFHSETTGSARYGSIRKNYDSPYDMRIRASNSTGAVPLIFEVSNSLEALKISSTANVNIPNGKLGIGMTTAPLSILHIGSGADANVPITLAPATGGNVEFRNTSSTGSFTFTNANGSSKKLEINADGSSVFSGAVTSTGQINAGTNLAAGTSVYSGNGVYYGSTTLALKNNTSGNFLSFAANANATFSGSVTSTGLTVNATGSAIELSQSATGSATYYTMDNTVETGGKRWRFGYSGGSLDKGSFSFYNQTDNNLALLLASSGATFSGSVTSTGLTVREDIAGSPTRIKISNGGTVQSGTSSRLSFYEGTSEKSYIERRRDGSGQTAFVTPADDNPFVFESSGSLGEFARFTGGNLGIGSSDPSSKFTNYKNTSISGTGGATLSLEINTEPRMMMTTDSSVSYISSFDSNPIVFSVTAGNFGSSTGTERMRLNADGSSVFSGSVSATNMQVSNGGKYIFGGENTRITGEIDGSGKIRLFTGGTEKVILDGANVGIGTSLPSNPLEIQHGTVGTGNGANNTLALRYNSSTLYGQHYMDANGIYHILADNSGAAGGNMQLDADTTIRLTTNNTERFRISSDGSCRWTPDGTTHDMTLTASGELLVGKTATANTASGVRIASYNGMTQGAVGTGLLDMHDFYRGTEGSLTRVGHIRTTGTATDYITSSDERLKENIVDANDSGTKVDAIQVRQFDWKADGSHQDYGMVAQELQTVAPDAVSGNADSDEIMGIDYSKLVPMLIKEIQSLRQRVASLEE